MIAVDEAQETKIKSSKHVMEHKAWLGRIARVEYREFAILDLEINFENFDWVKIMMQTMSSA